MYNGASIKGISGFRLLVGSEHEYLKKIRYFGVVDLERFKASRIMNEAIEDWTSKHTCEEIEEILKKPDIDIPCLKVPSFCEILENKHYQDREMFVEVEQRFSEKLKYSPQTPKVSF